MTEYELIIENMTPCGKEHYAIREFKEVCTDDPVEYIRQNGRYPITDVIKKEDGDILIITGTPAGYISRYTFTR